MSVSYIPGKTKMLLWGKAAGRCQYRGCNKCLYQDNLTKSEFNTAYIAHIVADKPDGPRGDIIRSPLLKKVLSNLMLMCDEHHRLIDRVDVDGHQEDVLLKMKEEHEIRMKRITAITSEAQCEIVIYKANVGKHSPVLTYESLSPFLLAEEKYPAQNYAIDLSMSNSPFRDKNESFWAAELENLEIQFAEQIRPRLRKGDSSPLSIYAFAPIPLLIKLGTLINDMQQATIHQKIRQPDTWNLSETDETTIYKVASPKKKYAQVALNISLSATITDDRITNILGKDCSIYTIYIDNPFNDFLKAKIQLEDFSIAIRILFNKIKATYDSNTLLHIFPAMPIATAIELGRVWMPKADMPLMIYDENTANSGFFQTIKIINK
jgi:hypothetical protein